MAPLAPGSALGRLSAGGRRRVQRRAGSGERVQGQCDYGVGVLACDRPGAQQPAVVEEAIEQLGGHVEVQVDGDYDTILGAYHQRMAEWADCETVSRAAG